MMGDSPCFMCKRPWKCAECHCFCKDFKEWEADHIAKREAELAVRWSKNEVYAQRCESVNKALRKRGLKT